MDREHRVIGALHKVGFPVSEAFGYRADETVAGVPFFVMGMVEGGIFRSQLLPGCPQADRPKIYRSMIRTVAKLHSYDPEALGLRDSAGRETTWFASWFVGSSSTAPQRPVG